MINKAPGKIYVADTTFPDYVDFDGSPINTKRIDGTDIEYIRADAFIEKACKFIHERTGIPQRIESYEGEPLALSYIDYAQKRLEAADKMIEDFRKYMKEE